MIKFHQILIYQDIFFIIFLKSLYKLIIASFQPILSNISKIYGLCHSFILGKFFKASFIVLLKILSEIPLGKTIIRMNFFNLIFICTYMSWVCNLVSSSKETNFTTYCHNFVNWKDFFNIPFV